MYHDFRQFLSDTRSLEDELVMCDEDEEIL